MKHPALERMAEILAAAPPPGSLPVAERQRLHADLIASAQRTTNTPPERDLFAPVSE